MEREKQPYFTKIEKGSSLDQALWFFGIPRGPCLTFDDLVKAEDCARGKEARLLDVK